MILPDGSFVFEDVQPGEWQMDVLYTQGFQARYVHSEFIVVTGEEEVIPVELSISLR